MIDKIWNRHFSASNMKIKTKLKKNNSDKIWDRFFHLNNKF